MNWRAGKIVAARERSAGYYWDRVWHPEGGSGACVIRVGKKYFVSPGSDDSPPSLDLGPFLTLRKAQKCAETILILREVPAAWKAYVKELGTYEAS